MRLFSLRLSAFFALSLLISNSLFAFEDFSKRFNNEIKDAQGRTLVFVATDSEPLAKTFLRLQAENKTDSKTTLFARKRTVQAFNQTVFQKMRAAAPKLNLEIGRSFEIAISGFSMYIDEKNIDAVRNTPGVLSITPQSLYKLPVQPEKTVVTSNTGDFLPGLDVQRVWNEFGVTGKGIKIAIVDTGMDFRHPDLGGCAGIGCKVVYTFNAGDDSEDVTDDFKHGTHVSGIAAGSGKKKGVAPDAELMSIKVFGTNPGVAFDVILRGMEAAIDPHHDGSFDGRADIINMSLGGVGNPAMDPPPEMAAFENVAKIALVVAAAGNSSYSIIGLPGSAPSVLTVASTNGHQDLSTYSSHGPTEHFTLKPDIAAPGEQIPSTVPGGGYAALSGTSMATPYMAGMAALVMQQAGNSIPKDKIIDYVKSRLLANTLPVTPFPLILPQANSTATRGVTTNFFHAGAGETNPVKTMASHSSFIAVDSFGKMDIGPVKLGDSKIEREFNLKVYCVSASILNLTLTSDFPEGTAGIQPNRATCEPGKTLEFKVSVHSDFTHARGCAEYPCVRGLTVSVKDDSSELLVPVAAVPVFSYKVDLDVSENLFDYAIVYDRLTGARNVLKASSKGFEVERLFPWTGAPIGEYFFSDSNQANRHGKPQNIWVQDKSDPSAGSRKIRQVDLTHVMKFKIVDGTGAIDSQASAVIAWTSHDNPLFCPAEAGVCAMTILGNQTEIHSNALDPLRATIFASSIVNGVAHFGDYPLTGLKSAETDIEMDESKPSATHTVLDPRQKTACLSYSIGYLHILPSSGNFQIGPVKMINLYHNSENATPAIMQFSSVHDQDPGDQCIGDISTSAFAIDTDGKLKLTLNRKPFLEVPGTYATNMDPIAIASPRYLAVESGKRVFSWQPFLTGRNGEIQAGYGHVYFYNELGNVVRDQEFKMDLRAQSEFALEGPAISKPMHFRWYVFSDSAQTRTPETASGMVDYQSAANVRLPVMHVPRIVVNQNAGGAKFFLNFDSINSMGSLTPKPKTVAFAIKRPNDLKWQTVPVRPGVSNQYIAETDQLVGAAVYQIQSISTFAEGDVLTTESKISN